MKKLGNEMAYVIGLAFIGLQALSYYGYITIDYKKIKEEATKTVDLDKDGKLTTKDLKYIWAEVKKILTYNLPGAGGFSAGLAMGLYF